MRDIRGILEKQAGTKADCESQETIYLEAVTEGGYDSREHDSRAPFVQGVPSVRKKKKKVNVCVFFFSAAMLFLAKQ